MSKTLLLASFALAFAPALANAQAAAQPAAQAAPKGDIVAGKKIYLENGCHACHGSVGQGGGPGPTLASTRMSYAGYRAQLRKPRSVMPPYALSLMSEQDVADTYAYLKAQPGARAEKDLPALLKAP
jgi:mono/diheme cytochrome c family protein